MHNMVFLDSDSMGDADLTPLLAANIQLSCYDSSDSTQLAARLQQADIAIVNKVILSAGVLCQLPELKLICVAATGVNNVDVAAARQLGITVCNVRGYADTAVPQHVFALLLQLTNKVQQYHQAVLDGKWSQSKHFCLLDYPVTELANKNFVVVGYGDLGCQAFDVVLNATSASLMAELPPLSPTAFAPACLAYELAYGKGLTPFLKLAQQAGVTRLADGVGMLAEQAAEAFEWWRGVRPDTAAVIAQLTVPLV